MKRGVRYRLKTINISQVDSVFADGSYPIEFLFFYTHKIKTGTIRSALKKLSADFWPLFGEYESGQINFERYPESEFCTEQVFQHQFDSSETYNSLFEKYNRFNPAEMQRLFHLTILQYTNGTVLIPKMNHLAGDGYSYFYFLSALAAITRSHSIPFKTCLTRLIYKPDHRRTILRKFIFTGRGVRSSIPESRFTIQFEEFPKQEIHRTLKDIKLQYNLAVSANDLLSAMAVKKLFLLQQEQFQDSMQLTIPMDVRRQIAEYGKKFFGNPLLFAVIPFLAATLRESDTREIALQIRKSIPLITKEGYIHYLLELENLITNGHFDKLKPYVPRDGCLVTNLTKMPAERLDFGTGYPEFIYPITIEKNSVAILTHKNNYLLRLAY
jgi:NRPS condensation-like uncharacterized protein